MDAQELTRLMDKAAARLRESGHEQLAYELEGLEIRDQGSQHIYLIFPGIRTRKVDMGDYEMRQTASMAGAGFYPKKEGWI